MRVVMMIVFLYLNCGASLIAKGEFQGDGSFTVQFVEQDFTTPEGTVTLSLDSGGYLSDFDGRILDAKALARLFSVEGQRRRQQSILFLKLIVPNAGKTSLKTVTATVRNLKKLSNPKVPVVLYLAIG